MWDSTSNNEIIVRSMAEGFDRHRVRQNITYLVIIVTVIDVPVETRTHTHTHTHRFLVYVAFSRFHV